VSHHVDAPMNAMQPSHPRGLRDGALRIPEQVELPSPNNPVLTGGQLGQSSVSQSNLSWLVAHRATKDDRLGISPPSQGRI
jgi:hypothetical protein